MWVPYLVWKMIFEKLETSVVEGKVKEREGFSGTGTHRDSLGSQGQQVLPKSLQGPFTLFIQILKKRVLCSVLAWEIISKQQTPFSAWEIFRTIYIQAFPDLSGRVKDRVHSCIFAWWGWVSDLGLSLEHAGSLQDTFFCFKHSSPHSASSTE